MPSTEFETAEWFMTFDDFRVKGMLEKVHAMPGQGVTSMFKFGQNYGFVRGCLFSSGIPFEDVHPKTWQKEFAITPRKSGEAKGLLKERLRAKAQQLFPDLAIWSEPRSLGKQRAICDALLIAEYCRRKFK
jgi:crossover junction endodeoxyribonuclease RuvC